MSEIVTFDAALVAQSQQIKKLADALVIWDDEQYKEATDFASNCQSAIKSIEARRQEIKAPFLDACRDIDAQAAALKEPFEYAKKTAQNLAYEYKVAQEKEVERLRQEALKKAEEERKRLEKEAEVEEAKVAEVATEEEKLEQQAKAMEIRAQAESVGTVTPIVSTVKNNAGMSAKVKRSATVTDKVAFIKWIAANIDSNPFFANFVDFKTGAINNFLKTNIDVKKMDGVLIEEVVTLSSRSKKAKTVLDS